MSELTSMDKIFELMIEEAEAREDLSTELNLLMICLEILDRFRDVTDIRERVVIQVGHDINWRVKLCDQKKKL